MGTQFYEVDFTWLINYLLPVRLRNNIMRSWLGSLVRPVRDLYDLFYQNRTNNLYHLSHNGQVVFLQAALNDVFDPSARGIYIDDGPDADPLFVYLEAETHPLWVGLASEAGTTTYPDPQWLCTTAETSASGYQFIVRVPGYLIYDTARMRALVDKYRLSSKNIYTITAY